MNSRLDDIQAAVLNVNLKYLDKLNSSRIYIASLYKNYLDYNRVYVQEVNDECTYHLFGAVIKTSNIGGFIRRCNNKGVPIRRHYPFKMSDLVGVRCKGSNYFNNLISLPMHPFLTEEEVKYISGVVNEEAGEV